MNRWAGRIAVVTGASAGVGAAVAVELVKQGLTVVGVARRSEKIDQLQEQVKGAKGKLIALKGDVSSVDEVRKIFKYVKDNLKTVHVLVNNAGFMLSGTFIDGNPEDWKSILDVNVIGLATCAQEAIRLMRDTGVNDGHIINVNSVAGHRIPPAPKTTFNIYPPSKYAVTAISETLRRELADIDSKIRVTNLSPGYIVTEFQAVASRNDPQIQAANAARLKNRPPLYPQDLADTINFILSAPPHVQNLSPGYIITEFADVASRRDPKLKAEFDKFLAGRPALYPQDLADSIVFLLSAPPHVQVHELTFSGI